MLIIINVEDWKLW